MKRGAIGDEEKKGGKVEKSDGWVRMKGPGLENGWKNGPGTAVEVEVARATRLAERVSR